MSALEGKIALVTGASRGIGRAIALRLAQDGADVAITYGSSSGAADETVEAIRSAGRKATALQVDVADADAVRAAVDQVAEQFGRLDILVNNAGVFQVKEVAEVTQEEIDQMIAVNVRAVYVASQQAARHMGPGSRIISIGSVNGTRTAFPGIALYGMSKAALIGFTKGLSRDLAGAGITVNTIEPGPTDTQMNPADGPFAHAMHGVMALNRHGKPEEIASMAAYLATPEAAFVTGANIPVDGGFLG